MSRALFESLQSRVLLHNTGPLKDDGANAGESGMDTSASFDDLLALAQNYGSSGKEWSSGDFNYSSGVTFADLLLLAQNYGSSGSIPQSYSAGFAADWQLASTLVGDSADASTASLSDKGRLTINALAPTVRVEQRDNLTRVTFVADTVGGSTTPHSRTLSFKKVKSIVLTGSDFSDTITLGAGLRPTTIYAGKGNDTINASDETATIHCGDGDDTVYAGGGDDEVFGEGGDDRLDGGTGDDLLDGGAGKDRLDGYKGKNRLVGGSGTDYVKVRPGRDKVRGDVKDRLTELA